VVYYSLLRSFSENNTRTATTATANAATTKSSGKTLFSHVSPADSDDAVTASFDDVGIGDGSVWDALVDGIETGAGVGIGRVEGVAVGRAPSIGMDVSGVSEPFFLLAQEKAAQVMKPRFHFGQAEKTLLRQPAARLRLWRERVPAISSLLIGS
jgi:hypothetical protein